MSLQDLSGTSDVAKGMPGPLELARMHEAELKQCYKQYSILGALVSKIMVGRRVTSLNSEVCEVTDIKLADGKVLVYGKPKGVRRRRQLICEGLETVEIVP